MQEGVIPTVWAEQAIYTSIPRRGRAGYHVVARSPGVPEADAIALANWAPSNGALIVDTLNLTSVNFHPLPSGRVALSRTCEGPSEYSGRGERQLYTHALIFEPQAFSKMGTQPIALYRDAMALGYLCYQRDPNPILTPVELGFLHIKQDRDIWEARARDLGLPSLSPLEAMLAGGQSIRYRYPGDRIALVECLMGLIPTEVIPQASFSTSLHPSAVRPYRLSLVN